MKKRFLSVLTALALCLTLLPAAALAADITRPSTGETETIGEVTGNGTIQSSQSVSKLDFRFSDDQPTVETQYTITDGGTAKWEPGNDSTPNKLTLDNVTMTGDYYVVGVPANTEIILSGENTITSTNGTAICAQNAPLKITGSGSLNVNVTAQAPASASAYALCTNISGDIDINITGALTVNGNIRANDGTLSLQSRDAISVTGSVYGKGSITATAGKSLNITNTSGTAVFASSCNEVSLAAQDGDLTVSGAGSGDYGIYGNWKDTALKLHASGNVSVTGPKYSMQGNTLELSGTIPENSTLTADGTKSLTVPAGKTLINNGTIKLISFPGAVTVFGTLTNNGSIFNEDNVSIQPKASGNGVITVKAAMDFTKKNENASGQGYEWDCSSKTLTLTNYKMTEPCNDTAIILPDGAKLILNGENTLNSKNGALIDAKGTLEISGTGSLTGSAGGEAALNAQGALTIMDCKLDLKNPSPWRTVICTNGNALTIADRADVSLHTAESSGWGIKTGLGGNFTLGSDAKLVIKGGTGILAQGASVKIAGTLDVSGCANLGANLLRVALNMEGSSITAPTKDKGGIYLYQNAAGTLTGQTDIKAFVGNFRVTSPNASIVNYYKVKKDDTLGLYAEGSTVSFTAEQKSGKAFSGWTATGVTLDNETNAEISFTMPGNDVTLSTAYVTLVSGITLDKTELALTVGDTQTLAATILPSDAANKSVSWSSDKPSVATVDENGKVTAVAEGTAKITVTTVDGKKTADCAVTVTAKSGGGSSSGGGTSGGGTTGGGSTGGGTTGGGSSSSSKPSASTGKTETVTKPDGTKVQTETKADGTKIQTTTGKDGSVTKTETKKDGSSVTENKAADGSTGTVKTDKNGQTEAKTKLSDKAIEDARRNGEAAKVPVEVKASRNSDTAPVVKVELPRNSGETKIEIPVSNVRPGTVAVLVHADGTEEILKDSVPTEGGVRLTVDGSATVKIVDNSKGFIDIRNHWAEDEIDFVSARGLVNGMSDTIYAPNNSTTRAQLWTILARQADADLTGGSVWYEKAQNWAKTRGVSDGANPNAAINRAQMVTMLWRTMGQPAAGGAATFTDVPADSYYAKAVAWAVENGITTGVGGGRFDPTATCTRAQIATFLARSMK
ncbi:S-layer homology domain-containing protein [Dysosmobacter sp.]|uniref:S-layer homology domain-containing protein n=1 Tax=Dysosmobacter sp. TaxID=2591382 RepID=UPI003AB2A392